MFSFFQAVAWRTANSLMSLGFFALNYYIITLALDVRGTWAVGAAIVMELPASFYRELLIADAHYE